MASSGKRKTTGAKLAREGRLRERRASKKAKKDAKRLSPTDDSGSDGFLYGPPNPSGLPEVELEAEEAADAPDTAQAVAGDVVAADA
jgi:hypothetical protein